MAIMTNGCASASCHNEATVGGEWARKSHVSVAAGDTVNFFYIEPGGRYRNYSQLQEPKLVQAWNPYKDSVRKFYQDTLAKCKLQTL
jgi:hypothetical protein